MYYSDSEYSQWKINGENQKLNYHGYKFSKKVCNLK